MHQQHFPNVLQQIHLGTFVFSTSFQTQFSAFNTRYFHHASRLCCGLTALVRLIPGVELHRAFFSGGLPALENLLFKLNFTSGRKL